MDDTRRDFVKGLIGGTVGAVTALTLTEAAKPAPPKKEAAVVGRVTRTWQETRDKKLEAYADAVEAYEASFPPAMSMPLYTTPISVLLRDVKPCPALDKMACDYAVLEIPEVANILVDRRLRDMGFSKGHIRELKNANPSLQDMLVRRVFTPRCTVDALDFSGGWLATFLQGAQGIAAELIESRKAVREKTGCLGDLTYYEPVRIGWETSGPMLHLYLYTTVMYVPVVAKTNAEEKFATVPN